MRWLGYLLVVVAILLIGLIAGQRPARAHGPAHWIQIEPSYLDRTGVHCCGETDCMVVDPSLLTETNDGISYGGQTLWRRERGIYPSNEPNPPVGQRYFVCVRAGKLKCIFRPHTGS